MNKEILEAAERCVSVGHCFLCPFEYKSCTEIFAKAITDHHNKYRWHDLLEGPNDLPSAELSECLIRELWHDGDTPYITHSIADGQYVRDYAGAGISSDLIAWREIDLGQFEESEEQK